MAKGTTKRLENVRENLLNRVLNQCTDQERKAVQRMQKVIKYMNDNHAIEPLQVERLKNAIQAEYKNRQEPSHISADQLIRLGEPILKVPQLG